MKDKTYYIVLYIVSVLCVLFTLGHALYDVYAYNHSSIIYFIGSEIWWVWK